MFAQARVSFARRTSSRLELALVFAALGGLLLPTAVGAQEEVALTNGAASELRGPTDAIELEAFLDGLMAGQMRSPEIVGATVSVVRDGQLLFSKGYGFANKEERIPVDPARTLFRIGSVTKLFTWTAVMQQVEAGTLDLNTNVEEYIDFEIPDTFAEPITLTHLLTHTPGLEDRALGLFGPTDLPRGEYLAANMPARVRPPGTYASYSNWGTALAGHIVERVSGMSWEDYVRDRILEPLGMRYATAHQPLPDALAPYMSEGYANTGGTVETKDFEIIGGAAPAGSMSASAEAMAKFMMAHLNGGVLDGARILSPETSERMHTRQFTHDERLNGFAYGFYEKSSHGQRIIGHGGDTQWFHTDLALIPQERLGVFVSYNTGAGGSLSFGPFLEAFLDHYYPVEPPALPTDSLAEEAVARYTGLYRANRMSYTTFERALGLAGAMSVEADGAALVVQSPLGPMRFIESEPGLFRDVDGSGAMAFEEDETGAVTHMFLSLAPMMAMEKLSFWGSPKLHQVLLAVAVLAFAMTVISNLTRVYQRRRYGVIPRPEGGALRARRLALAVSIVNLAFVGGVASVIGDPSGLLAGDLGSIRWVLGLGVLSTALTIVAAGHALLAWKDGYWRLWDRMIYGTFTILAVTFVVVLNHWNLIGWKLG